VFEEVELVIDEATIELPYAIGMPEEVGSRISKIVARAIGDVMREFDLLHLGPIDGMRTEIAGNR